MQTLIELLGMASMGAMLQQFEGYQWLVKRLPQKPFSCTLCATFWYIIGINIAMHGWLGVCYSALEAVLAETIDRKLNQF